MSKVKLFFNKIWLGLKDFFNPKDWLKTLRSVPALALALITVATVLMNILANKSIINLPIKGTNSYWLVQDAGILLSWVGFLVGDLIVKAFGSKHAIRVSLTCLGISLFISALLAVVGIIPGTWSAEFNYSDPNIAKAVGESINAVMGNVWYVILGSAIASAVGLIINGITQGCILKRMHKKHGDKYWGFFVASAASTIIGQILDNMVFAAIVSVKFFGWTWGSVFACSIAGAIFELIIELIFSPLTYRISKNWQKNHIGEQWIETDAVKMDVDVCATEAPITDKKEHRKVYMREYMRKYRADKKQNSRID